MSVYSSGSNSSTPAPTFYPAPSPSVEKQILVGKRTTGYVNYRVTIERKLSLIQKKLSSPVPIEQLRKELELLSQNEPLSKPEETSERELVLQELLQELESQNLSVPKTSSVINRSSLSKRGWEKVRTEWLRTLHTWDHLDISFCEIPKQLVKELASDRHRTIELFNALELLPWELPPSDTDD